MSVKDIIHERDRHRCMNCHATEEIAELLDVDHVVPRGVGGGEPLSNQITLCRRCHDAKHGNGLAPTVRVVSTGTMTDTEFAWYKHFIQEMVPALARLADAQVRPKFGLEDASEWCLPLGDLRRLDDVLSEEDSQYRSLKAHRYM